MRHPALTEYEIDQLDERLASVQEGAIPNVEALDGFFAALICCPDLVKPSEYMSIIQIGANEDGDMEFATIEEACEFMDLIQKHWNHVNAVLSSEEVFLPLFLEDDEGKAAGNDWAQGFLTGTKLRPAIWAEVIQDEDLGGMIIPMWALAHEHHPNPEERPFDAPVDEEHREQLLINMAAMTMNLYEYFYDQRVLYMNQGDTFMRSHNKIGRNDPCLCGSGKKYKKCCGGKVLH